MTILLGESRVDELDEAVRALRAWQYDGAPVQLHPGDLGWHWRLGAEATAAAVRTWSRDGVILAVGLLDEPTLLRLAIAPSAEHDVELAGQIVADVGLPESRVLPAGEVSVEARFGEVFRGLLFDDGWVDGEPWTPLRRDLAEPVPDCGLRVEVVGPERAGTWAAVVQSSFGGSSSSTGDRWFTMAAGPAYPDARSLVAYDSEDAAVAAVTVWSAGADRPGLLEPMGVHPEHRGRGHGRAITVAAAAALRDLGSSSATVCTPSSLAGAVATYRSAGFEQLPEVRDLHRPATAATPARHPEH